MYANLVTFKLGAGKRQVVEKLTEKFDSAFPALKGFKGVTYLGNDETGQYAALVTWETAEDAETAFQGLFPQLQQAM